MLISKSKAQNRMMRMMNIVIVISNLRIMTKMIIDRVDKRQSRCITRIVCLEMRMILRSKVTRCKSETIREFTMMKITEKVIVCLVIPPPQFLIPRLTIPHHQQVNKTGNQIKAKEKIRTKNILRIA